MKTLPVSIAFILVTSLATTVNAQKSQKIGDKGHVLTEEPSDKYGPGGKHTKFTDPRLLILTEKYYDKCGRLREFFNTHESGKKDSTAYYDENGKHAVTVYYGAGVGGADKYQKEGVWKDLDPKVAKALIAKLENTPSGPPCPEPEKGKQAKEEPQPKGKSPGKSIFDSVHIGIGIGGGHTIGHDDRGRSGKSTGYKSLPAGCKCHPCSCSPSCTCH